MYLYKVIICYFFVIAYCFTPASHFIIPKYRHTDLTRLIELDNEPVMMPERTCSIPLCPNTVDNMTPGTKFFRFPKKKEVRNVWMERCRRQGVWDPDLCLICSDHFGEDDYYRDLRVRVDGPDYGLRLKKSAVPSLRLGNSGISASAARINMIKILGRQKKMDLALQPKSDPLALYEEDLQVKQTDDSNFTECKADIKDLVSSTEFAADDHDHFGQSDRDPLDISDIQSKTAGCTKQDSSQIPLAMTGVLKTYLQTNKSKKLCLSSNTSAGNSQVVDQARTFLYSSCIIFSLVNEKPFCNLSPDEQRQVMLAGKPASDVYSLNKMSKRASTVDGANECLSQKQLWWITSSGVMKKIFCWPCLLFGKGETLWNTKGLSHVLPEEVEMHEKSQLHVSSFFQYTMFAEDSGIHALKAQKRTHQISTQNSEVQKNREVFHRLIDAVCILTRTEMPKHNQNDNGLSLVQEVYLDIVDAFGKYDALLKSYLQTASENKLTSRAIRDDLINSIETILLDKIKQEVESAKCVSIICGEVSDELEAKNRPLFTSIVLRYVDSEGNVRERFVGYYGNTNFELSAKILCNSVLKLIMEYKLADKLVFFSNDGQHNLLHCREAFSSCPSLIYVPIFRKSFSLVLKQVCSGIEECRLFLSMLPRLSAFFPKASKQRIELESFLHKIVPEFSPGVLDFQSNLERTVFRLLPQLLMFFQNIVENPENWDNDAVVSALGFKVFLQSFSTIFFLHLFASLFNYTNLLYKTPEFMTFTDYNVWASRVQGVKLKIFLHHKKLPQFWGDILAKEADCDLATNTSQSKKNSDEPSPFYERLYFQIINLFHERISEELASFELFKFLDLLNPKCFGSTTPSAENLQGLETVFPNYFDVGKLKNELSVLYGINDLTHKMPHKYIGYLGTLKDAQQLVEVHKLVCLYLTIPSTQASLEPLFPALKRMKNVYELFGHHPSSNLAVLAIENTLLFQLKELPDFYGSVLNEYTKRENELELLDLTVKWEVDRSAIYRRQ